MLSVVLTACSDDDYKWASVSGDQVYFSSELSSVYDLSKQASSFNVEISRVKSDAEVTVPITAQLVEGSILTVPSSVTFKEGEKTATITISYDPAKVVYGTYEDVVLAIGDDNYTTEYGYSTYKFKAGATEWVDMEANKSIGYFRDDCLSLIFDLGAPVTEVHVQKSIVNEGMYRVVEPYSSFFSQVAAEAKAEGSSNPFAYDETTAHTWVINATDPNLVYFETCNTGMSFVGQAGYGEISLSSAARVLADANNMTVDQLKQSHPQYFGTLEDGIITMPAGAMAISMVGFQEGNFLVTNKNGLFALALPGYEISDYSVSAEYTGRYTDANNNDYANFNITFGADVASVKYALVDAKSTIDAVVEGIVSGSVEAAETTKSGAVKISYEKSGKYALVMVAYNAAKKAVGSATLNINLSSSNDAAAKYKAIASGVTSFSLRDLSSVISQKPWGTLEIDAKIEAVLSQNENEPTEFKISPFMLEGTELEFTLDENGVVYVDSQESSIANQQGNKAYASDIVTFFGPDTDNGKQMLKYGYNSSWNKKDGVIVLNLLYHTADMTGFFAFEQEKFEILDELESPKFAAAVAKAKKAAAERKYIMRPAETHKMGLLKKYSIANRASMKKF